MEQILYKGSFFMQKLSILIITSALVFSTQVFSAQVLKVKGSAVLIDTEGENIKKGKLYYLISASGKKKGIVKIAKTKPGKAIAKLVKGKAAKSWTLRLRKSKKSKKAYAKKETAPEPKIKPVVRKKKKSYSADDSSKKLSVGFVIGYNSDSSDVSFLDTNGNVSRNDSYSGTSLSYGLLLDYKWKKKLSIRTGLGLHNFSTEDSSNLQCIGSDGNPGAVCKIDLSYISIDAWLRYRLTEGKYNFWAGGGAKILISPSSGGTTALNEDDLGTGFNPQIGGGLDYIISDKLYVPVWAQYSFAPPTDTVKSTSIGVYFGLAYRL